MSLFDRLKEWFRPKENRILEPKEDTVKGENPVLPPKIPLDTDELEQIRNAVGGASADWVESILKPKKHIEYVNIQTVRPIRNTGRKAQKYKRLLRCVERLDIIYSELSARRYDSSWVEEALIKVKQVRQMLKTTINPKISFRM